MKKYMSWITLILLLSITGGIVNAQLPIPPPTPGMEDDEPDDPLPVENSCENGAKNQDESDIDCGGSCKKCDDNRICSTNNDCINNYCNPNNLCSIPICSDGWKNGNEIGIDCGGNCIACSETIVPDENPQNLPGSDQRNNNTQQTQGQTQNTGAQDTRNLPGISSETNDSKSNIVNIKAEDNKELKKINTLLAISLILNFFSLIVLTIVIFKKLNARHNIPKGSHSSSNAYSGKRKYLNYINLKNYISRSLKMGLNEQNVKQRLISGNWPENEVNRALIEVKYGSRRNF